MVREALLISILGSLLAAVLYATLTKKLLPTLREFWAGMRPFAVGDTVSWNKSNYLIVERSGSVFRYRYKLVDVVGMSPWLLPTLPCNPQLAIGATIFWYAGSKGRCYLKKTGHPRLELKTTASSHH